MPSSPQTDSAVAAQDDPPRPVPRRLKLPSGAINSVALGISSGLNFLSLIVWTHFLTPAEFGSYAMVSATVLFLNATAFEWIRLTALRLLYDRESATEINQTAFNSLTLMLTVIAAALLPIGFALKFLDFHILGISPEWWPTIWLWLCSEVLFAISTVTARLRMQSWRYFYLMTLRSSVSVAIGLVLVLGYGYGALGVAYGVLTAQIGCALGLNLRDAVWLGARPLRARKEEILRIASYGAPLIISSSLGWAGTLAERTIVSQNLGQAAVGQYSVSADLMQKTVIFLMLAINTTAYPAIVRTFERDGVSAGERKLSENFIIYLMVGAPAAATLAALSPGVARLLVGEKFRDAVELLLPYVAITSVLRGLTSFHLSIALQLMKKTKVLIASPIISLVFLFPCAFAGIRLAGLSGMAMGVALSQLASFLTFYLFVRRYVQVRIVNFASIFVVGTAAALALALAPMRDHSQPVVTMALLTGAWGAYALVMWSRFGWIMRKCHVGA